MNVIIVFGGKSVEHDISVITYFQILNSIDLKKYNVYPVYFSKDNEMYYSKEFFEMDIFKSQNFRNNKKVKRVRFERLNNHAYMFIKSKKIEVDVAVISMHGKDLEDGTISGYFNILGVPTTINNVDTSSVLHDKYYMKLALEKIGVKVINYKLLSKRDSDLSLDGEKIVKACKLGSSIGVVKAYGNEEIKKAVKECLKYDDRVIVEDLLNNYLELNQALYLKKGKVVLSAIEEVKTNNELYSFEKKYQRPCERILPAKINKKLELRVNRISEKIGNFFLINGVIRIDYLYDLDSKNLYVNEINLVPGAFSYYLFEEKGIFFRELLDDLIAGAIRKKYDDNLKISTFSSSVLFSEFNNKK